MFNAINNIAAAAMQKLSPFRDDVPPIGEPTAAQFFQIPIMPGSQHPSLSFTYRDFRQGNVTVEQIRQDYEAKPVEHQGNIFVDSNEKFKEVVGVPLAADLEGTKKYLGVALHAMTGGLHPIVDWDKPGPLPDGHPRINFGRVARVMREFGYT